MDIPVANGKIIQSFMHERPIVFFKIFRVILFVSFTIKLDPIAFG
jgi:hypothetical protein